MATLTTAQACRRLRMSHHTFMRWCGLLSITGEKHQHDRRYRLVTEEDVERIQAARAELRIATTLSVASVLPLPPLDPPPSAPVVPRPAQRAVGMTGHSPGHHESLPDGWIAWIRLSEELGLPGTTARRFIDKRLIPFHEGEWDSGVADRPFKYALDPEQQEAARQIVQARRPRA